MVMGSRTHDAKEWLDKGWRKRGDPRLHLKKIPKLPLDPMAEESISYILIRLCRS